MRTTPPRRSPRGPLRLPLFVRLLLALVVLFVVLYPDPRLLVRSVRHLQRPPVDAVAVAGIAKRLPDDPREIERIVLDRIVPYGYDWQVSGAPWYFPTTAEAVRARRGDCESRALVLASILQAKGIPHHLMMSFDHIWVDYPGKQANAMENSAVAFADQKDGRFSFGWPAQFHPWQEWKDQLAIFWVPMPPLRKALLFLGLLLVLSWNAWTVVVARRLGLMPVPALRPEPRTRGRGGSGWAPAAQRSGAR
jgi:hypothetical protein